MTKTSLRALHFALALAVILASGAGPARAATHLPLMVSDTGWPTELVNRPVCGSDLDYGPSCEAGRR